MTRRKTSLWIFFAFIASSLLVFNVEICEAVTPSQLSIKFENGRYNGITIGIDGSQVEPSDCVRVLEKLNITLSLFSESLYQATEGRASIGQVNILVPLEWTRGQCNNASFSAAATSDTYHSSHIQITKGHPMTSEDVLPWTRQYRSCGQPSDFIILPLPFLLSSADNFSDSIKAKFLLHEWTKFRYGAFDEIGYDDDVSEKLSFPPCYTYEKQAHLTVCSNSPTLSAVAANESACTSEFLLRYMDTIRSDLEQGSTSIMSSPYLSTVTHFCDNATHNPWSLTKQNTYCERQSVSQVVFSHPDFQASSSSPSQQSAPPTLNIIKHANRRDPAYAFVIEVSSATIQHVKQAIAQYLDILQVGTDVYIFLYSGGIVTFQNRDTLRSDYEKTTLLGYISDINKKHLQNLSTPSNFQSSDLLSPVIQTVVETLSSHQSFSWNVLLFSTGSTPTSENDMSAAIRTMENTPHSISIFTFENSDTAASRSSSKQWLLWYGIPNTRNVVPVPYCVRFGLGGPCTFRSSAFITDHLVGLLNNQHFDSRFLQNPTTGQQMGILNQAGQRLRFEIQGYESSSVQNVYIYLSIPTNSIANPQEYIGLISSSGGICTVNRLLGYNSVIKFGGNDCTLTATGGQWSLEILREVHSEASTLYLNVWAELDEATSTKLLVTPSLGIANPAHEIQPNNQLVPIFVAIQTPEGFPVIDAQVTLQVFHQFQFPESISTLVLRDDGMDGSVDITQNDGIYSAYLNGFSQEYPSFHLVQIQITTTAQSKILTKIQPPNAILLDEEMMGKCCGKRIRALDTISLQPEQIKFQELHLGFRTQEGWNKRSHVPPEMIRTINFTETDSKAFVQFVAVSGENSAGATGAGIFKYHICCVPIEIGVGNDSVMPPTAASCKTDLLDCGIIQTPGDLQTCHIDKQYLVRYWVPGGDTSLIDRVLCALRAVNDNAEFGPVSQTVFMVNVENVENINEVVTNRQQNCQKFSLSDKCLPMWIFWVMIGCLAFLVLIILIIIFCYCWRRSTNSKKDEGSNENVITSPAAAAAMTTRENILAVHYTPPPGQPNNTRTPDVNFNRHGTNNNGSPPVEDPKVVKELFVNHAYIQDGDGEIKIITDNGQILRKSKKENTERAHQQPSSSHMMENNGNNMNMQIFKPATMPIPNRPSRSNKSREDQRIPVRRGERPVIVHPNQMLRSDSTYDDSRPQPSYVEVASPPQPPPRNSADPALVYATISRRFKPPSQHIKQVTFDPHYQVPHNSVPVSPPPPPHVSQRQPAPFINRDQRLPGFSPPRMPDYPTTTVSESDTSTDYDDHHRNQRSRRVPPQFTIPPPYPAGSQLVNSRNPHHQNNQRMPQQQQFAGGARNIPVQPPPPVPPPRSVLKTPSPGATFATKQNADYDDDSDQWDDEDYSYDFDNTTGVSHA